MAPNRVLAIWDGPRKTEVAVGLSGDFMVTLPNDTVHLTPGEARYLHTILGEALDFKATT